MAQSLGLCGGHDPGNDIVIKREHSDGGLADRKSRRSNDGRQQALKAFSRFGKLGRDTGRTAMDLGTDMMSDQTHDAFAIGGR